MTVVLLVESVRANGVSFAPHLMKRYDVLIATTGKAALELAQAQRPDICILDAASMRTSGDRLCKSLQTELADVPIIHIKEKGATKDQSVADTIMHLPFTYRKLYNRIDRHTQSDRGDILKTGPFQLNLQQSILTTPTGEKKLTPKLTKLMEILMRNSNEIVDRRTLMQEVWQTDYMGDTRTLDVHIRWIRQAVEDNPNKPAFIKTVRGKGYILKIK